MTLLARYLHITLSDLVAGSMMAAMHRRILIWAGVVVTVAAMAGLGVYFWRVGLDDADKLASVIGAFVALAGLGTAVYGLVTSPKQLEPQQGEPEVSASKPDSFAIGGDIGSITSTGDDAINVHMRAEASGQGRVYQAGRDQTINE
ncbi:hypothetical protein [Nonomuraea jabiensis]|uniref:hypothetical protein n=1 Tax=Nonomuraea jabiensis TaxID=882448 RepID=UPI0036A93557